mgnify:CR=1 FL=1
MDLEIRYENGSMTVHLEEFLSERRIAKVRKLLKVIRSSFTPECEQQMKEFIQEQTEQTEQVQKEHSIYIERSSMQNSRSGRQSTVFHRFRRVLKTRSFSGIHTGRTQKFGRIAMLM